MSKGFSLTPPKISENDVEYAVKQVLQYRGYYVVRLQSGKFKTADGRWITVGDPGLPDYVAVHPRHPALFVEVKCPGGHLRDTQLQKIWEMECGYKIAVAVVDSAEALSRFLDQHERTEQR